jgi:hypothetical protein
MRQPFTSNGFGNRFRKRCDEAKLPPQCSADDLRMAGATFVALTKCQVDSSSAIRVLAPAPKPTAGAFHSISRNSRSAALSMLYSHGENMRRWLHWRTARRSGVSKPSVNRP